MSSPARPSTSGRTGGCASQERECELPHQLENLGRKSSGLLPLDRLPRSSPAMRKRRSSALRTARYRSTIWQVEVKLRRARPGRVPRTVDVRKWFSATRAGIIAAHESFLRRGVQIAVSRSARWQIVCSRYQAQIDSRKNQRRCAKKDVRDDLPCMNDISVDPVPPLLRVCNATGGLTVAISARPRRALGRRAGSRVPGIIAIDLTAHCTRVPTEGRSCCTPEWTPVIADRIAKQSILADMNGNQMPGQWQANAPRSQDSIRPHSAEEKHCLPISEQRPRRRLSLSLAQQRNLVHERSSRPP